MNRKAQHKRIYSEIKSIVLPPPHRGKKISLKSVATPIAKLLTDYQTNKSNPESRRPIDLYSKALKTAIIQFRRLPERFQFAAIEEDLTNKLPVARKLRWFYSAKRLRNLLMFKLVSLLTAEGFSKNAAYEIIEGLMVCVGEKGIDMYSIKQHIRRVINFYMRYYPELKALSSQDRFKEIEAKLDKHIHVVLLPRSTYDLDFLHALTRNTNVRPSEIVNDLSFFASAKYSISYVWCAYLLYRQSR